MTPQQKRAVTTGVVTSTIGAALLWLASVAWTAKVDKGEYDLHVLRDSSWEAEQREMTLDVLCSPNVDPSNRRCR